MADRRDVIRDDDVVVRRDDDVVVRNDLTQAEIKQNRDRVKMASGLNVVAGLWLAISPFILDYDSISASTNTIIVGLAVALLAAIRAFGAYRSNWLSWVNVVLGLWLIVSPFIIDYDESVASWNTIILGVIVTALALWSALTTKDKIKEETPRR